MKNGRTEVIPTSRKSNVVAQTMSMSAAMRRGRSFLILMHLPGPSAISTKISMARVGDERKGHTRQTRSCEVVWKAACGGVGAETLSRVEIEVLL